MTTPVADNPAVTNPNRALNMSQRDALMAVAYFRHHRQRGPNWLIGSKNFSKRTIDTLVRLELVKPKGFGLDLTLAGKLAHSKLTLKDRIDGRT